MSALAAGARTLGVELSAGQLAQFDQFQAALLDWNARVNLTSITSAPEVEVKHFLDSLTAAVPVLARLRAGEAPRAIDVGTGGGFPGIPLKIAFPRLKLTLLEATGKKARFLRAVVEMLQLSDVEVKAARAEDLARLPGHRDEYGLATARALGSLATVVELCAPFLEPGGLLVAQRRGDLEAELRRAAPAFSALKVWARAPVPIQVPGLADGRGLIVGEKHGPTPSRYPRRSGMARKDPISA
ncbi:MAG: 16S rRNA (guanine(527)-N(7))-methyltransferase RsmG [Chloroflexi bacterium]|nr:16S rRNA (guanine(527)-N(7))-methyltransferase RsmG [Chloroflexota bacterium]